MKQYNRTPSSRTTRTAASGSSKSLSGQRKTASYTRSANTGEYREYRENKDYREGRPQRSKSGDAFGYAEKGGYKKTGAKKSGSFGYGSFERSYEKRSFAKSEDKGFGKKSFEKKPYEKKSYEKKGFIANYGYDNDRREKPDFDINPNLIIGRNPVAEAIKSGRTIDKILMQKDAEGSAKKIASMARENKLMIQYVDKLVLDKMCPGRPHQGVVAYGAAHAYAELKDILQLAKDRGEDPFVVLLDGLEDPHNLGAVIRSCDGAGAHGVVIPSRRAVGLTEVVAKASAGAIEYVPVAKVSNLASAIDQLKEAGLWTAAVDMDGENYTESDLKGPLALVIGGEGSGVSKLIREKCDRIVSIPMKGKVNSLNASNAAAVVLYEAVRQRG